MSWWALGRAAAITLVLSAILSGCGGDDGGNGGNGVFDAFLPQRDGGAVAPGRRDLALLPDGLPTNAEGPQIEFLAPTESQIVVGNVLRVQARITDPDGISAQAVTIGLQDERSVVMGLTATPDVYESLLDVSEVDGPARLILVAADLLGNENSGSTVFERDPGPVIQFLSPAADSRHKSSVSIQVVVEDDVALASFEVAIGQQPLTLTQTSSSGGRGIYVGQIKFDDPAFGLPLSGRQVLTATAQNANGARKVELRAFFVDDQGPEITIVSHVPGQLIGGIIPLEATVTDLAGVLPTSVRCVIGNNLERRSVELEADPLSPGTYRGQFDTRTLTNRMIWPVMSFRAADQLGNESHRDIEVGLDNGPPIISLDPPTSFYLRRERAPIFECSLRFDPVGDDAADDLESVPQLVDLRARIEDQGNHAPSAEYVPISTVDPATVSLYVLPASVGKPLVIDTDGDSYCDAINSEVVPIGSNPSSSEAVAVGLAAIEGTGSGDFRNPLAALDVSDDSRDTNLATAGCFAGTEVQKPARLCLGTPMTVVITYPSRDRLPAIWAIPPIVASHNYHCEGTQFDFRANDIPDGWVCAAVQARDMLGTLGVSEPLRLWVRQDETSPATATSAPPHCLGTLDKATGRVTSTPCQFRPRGVPFPQVFPSVQVRDI